MADRFVAPLKFAFEVGYVVCVCVCVCISIHMSVQVGIHNYKI